MTNFYFIDKANNNEIYCIEAESHPEAIDIANEVITEPEFWYADDETESEVE